MPTKADPITKEFKTLVQEKCPHCKRHMPRKIKDYPIEVQEHRKEKQREWREAKKLREQKERDKEGE